ncbi:MAG: TonB-dependent receptor [Bacteroidetes bacterium]|nr:TonB-dependent receptor [Bacteroidota bacterium]
MKLTIALFLFGLVSVSATTYSQNTKMDISLKNNSIVELIKEIEQNSEFYFFYKKEELKDVKNISVDLENATVMEILDKVIEGSDLAYKVVDRYVVLREKGQSLSIDEIVLQQKTLTGTVTDESGQPLPGVTVLIKGTTNGTVTNMDGNYSISSIQDGAVLVFSFIGMLTQEFVISNQTTINVTLEIDAIGIDEVVAIGYGTIRNSQVTGAIAKIKSDDIKDLPVGRIDQALQGKMAGVQVQQVSGTPGRAASIKVRGTSSISFANSPLYVIDGYPIDGDLSRVNTNDIESIEVLKDAASTAIYGSRGSNGVILITTKTGQKGKPVFSADVYYGVQKRFSKYDVLNRDQWIDFAIEERNNTYLFNGGDPSVPSEDRPGGYATDPLWKTDPSALPDNDWQDLTSRIAPIMNVQLSASGANESVKYYVSGTYFDQDGVIVNSYYNRMSFQANVETMFSDVVSFGLNLSGAITEQNDPETDDYGKGIHRSWLTPPVVGVDQNTNNTGFYPYAGTFLVNPLEWMGSTLKQKNGNFILANTYVNIALAKNFKWRSTLGIDRKGYYTEYFKKAYVNRNSGTRGSAGSNYTQNYLTEHTLNYQLEKSNWKLDAMGGFTYQTSSYNTLSMAAKGFPDDAVHTLNVATDVYSGSSYASKWSLMSFIGRVNMFVKDKYLLTANIRRDGSSRFGNENRWGWFPSLSLGWRMTEEDFMKDIDWLNNLKLRGSYGIVGNNNIGDYASIGSLGIDNAIMGNPENIVSGIAPTSFSNSTLGWESTTTTDIGVDIGLLRNRIQINTDYYVSNTHDLLLNLQIPQVTGFSSSLQNIGEVQNRGFEFELNTKNIAKGAFMWNTSFNISFNKNEVLALGPDEAPVYGYAWKYLLTKTEIGKPIGSYYLLEQEGVFMDQADFDSHPHYKTQEVGDIKYKDYNNDGVIDENDIHDAGDASPDFFWGMRNTFSYKGFDLSVDMDGQQGAQGLNLSLRSGGQSRNNEWAFWDNRWRSEEDTGDGMTPRALKSPNMTTPSTFWLFDASYWSIRNINFGYSFSEKLARKIPGVNSLRIYSNVSNLFMNDNYHHTPMAGRFSNTPLTPSIDYGASYPIATTYTFGINLKF